MRGILLVVGLCGVAGAQPLPRAEDKAEADRLFEEGRTLLAQGNRAEACKKFDLSIRKDPRAVGTMLNLGLCREETGQVASAIRLYAEARDRARDQNLAEHKEAAERKIAMLSPRVPHLTISGVPANARVLVDDVVMDQEQLLDVTVDPGSHTIVVTAPGKLPYETKLEVKESERRALAIPVLEGAKTVVVRESNRRMYGTIATGTGAVLVAGGIGLGLYARHKYWQQFPAASRDGRDARDDAHDCWTDMGERKCNDLGSSRLANARLLAHTSTGLAIAGAITVGIGVALWLTAPASHEATAVSLDVGAQYQGLVVRGAF